MIKVYERGWNLFTARPLLFSAIALTLSLPTALLMGFLGDGPAADQVDALFSLLQPIAAGALIYALSKTEAGEKVRYPEAMGIGLRMWGKLLAARFVASVLIGLGTLALIVPGVILAVRYALIEQVIVMEGAGVNESRRRSASLTKGRGWDLLGAVVVFGFVVLVCLLPVLVLQASVAESGSASDLFSVVFFLILFFSFNALTVLLFAFYADAKAGEKEAQVDDEGLLPAMERGSASTLRRLAYSAVVVIVVVISFLPSIRWTLVAWYDVPTGAMKPSILEGDRILVNRAAFGLKLPLTYVRLAEWDGPARGDIVIFRSPENGKLLVKRVIALPGETVEIRDNHLVVNDTPATYRDLDPELVDRLDEDVRASHLLLSESIGEHQGPIMISAALRDARGLSRSLLTSFGPYQVPAAHYFLMGDNRSNSRDSRYFGPVERSEILGKATKVALSFDIDDSYSPRWERFWTPLP